MAWAIARAHVQSITIDEADTYLYFVSHQTATHFYPAANNQVLNSMLMRLFTTIFGASHLTVRLPALIGAALYFSAVWRIATSLTDRARLQWPLLVCLAYNPFVFDYLVAARGYSLALGFFTWILALPCWLYLRRHTDPPISLDLACALCSVCAGLSIAANFSFALACVSTMLAVVAWAWPQATGLPRRARVLACCVAPATGVLLFLCGSVVRETNRAEFVVGARSLVPALRSLLSLSLYRVNPELVNRLLRPGVVLLGPLALTLVGLFAVLRAAVALGRHLYGPRGTPDRRLLVAVAAAGVFLLTASLHLAMHAAFHVLLPSERTALFFVPLALLSLEALAAAVISGRIAQFTASGLAVSLTLLAGYSLCCLRLTYFELWIWDADVRQAYDTVAFYNHRYGVRDVPASWHFVSALNFYRAIGHESLGEFKMADSYPANRNLYVLLLPFDQPFLDREHLKTVYHGETSNLVVAIRPELETRTALCVNAVTGP